MPSIRVLLAFVSARLGISNEHSTGYGTGQFTTGVRLNQDISGGIQHKKSYSIEYSTNLNGDGSKFMQLVDMAGAASSRSEISVTERVRKESSWIV